MTATIPARAPARLAISATGAAQVVRRPRRAGRRRPRRGRGNGVRAARPQRRGQDHHGADPVHAAAPPTVARSAWRATTWPAIPTRCAPRSGSPASSRPWTACSPARRTCGSWPTCITWDAAPGGAAPRSCSSQFDLSGAAGQAGRHLLRGHAAPARPRDDPGRPPPPDLPGRADHRARPAQPPHHVADHPRPRRRRSHDLPDHAVPGRGGPARGPGRRTRPRQARRRGHPRGAQAPDPRRPHPPGVRQPARPRLGRPHHRRGRPRRRGAQPCRCPATAASRRCGPCWPGSTPGRSRSRPCPCTPPISTTCSSPSPGRLTRRWRPAHEHPVLRRHRFGHDAAPQPPAHAALPVHDAADRGHAGRLPAAVRLRLRRHAGRRAGGRARGPGRLRQLRRARDPADYRGRRGAGDGHLGGHGHDRGHHGPVPDHGHLAGLGAGRPRPGQHHPEPCSAWPS